MRRNPIGEKEFKSILMDALKKEFITLEERQKYFVGQMEALRNKPKRKYARRKTTRVDS